MPSPPGARPAPGAVTFSQYAGRLSTNEVHRVVLEATEDHFRAASTSRRRRPRCEMPGGRALRATLHVAKVAALRASVLAVNNRPSERATVLLER